MDVVIIIPLMMEYIKEFIPVLISPVIIKIIYLIIIDISDTKNNLFVLFIACIATDNVGCI